jgi:hypothetical protein
MVLRRSRFAADVLTQAEAMRLWPPVQPTRCVLAVTKIYSRPASTSVRYCRNYDEEALSSLLPTRDT